MDGDEFAILLQRCPRRRAEEVAAKILAAIEEFTLHWEGGKLFRVGASIGAEGFRRSTGESIRGFPLPLPPIRKDDR